MSSEIDDRKQLSDCLSEVHAAALAEQEARRRLYERRALAAEPLHKVRKTCRHERCLQIESRAYVTEANSFQAVNIVVCDEPRRICLDYGLVEKGCLDARFKDDGPMNSWVRIEKNSSRKKTEQLLAGQKKLAEQLAQFSTMKDQPVATITAEVIKKSLFAGIRLSNAYSGYLEPEDIYALWLKYGAPITLD
ncbi:hypothetical protein KKF05_02340 [Patescibacteria group bacterium]|nr:hypothetical protein [Patescibacteria group bacterium]MBU1029120.1 hypothetical protein [Patescibacteria group bacterium]